MHWEMQQEVILIHVVKCSKREAGGGVWGEAKEEGEENEQREQQE